MNRVKKVARLYLLQRPAINVEREVYRRRREANRRQGTAPAQPQEPNR